MSVLSPALAPRAWASYAEVNSSRLSPIAVCVAVTSLAAVPLNVEAGATRLCSTENARIGRVERALDTRHKREV
ncbi:MAG: hypothetical protein ACI9BK_003094, partial [Acidimicrobiales bacterium]